MSVIEQMQWYFRKSILANIHTAWFSDQYAIIHHNNNNVIVTHHHIVWLQMVQWFRITAYTKNTGHKDRH